MGFEKITGMHVFQERANSSHGEKKISEESMFNVNHWDPSRDGGSSKAEWHSQTTPPPVSMYNKHMSGVDLLDQMVDCVAAERASSG